MLWKSMILPAECGSPTDVGEGLIEGGPGEAERNAGREGAAVGLGDHGLAETVALLADELVGR